jgi:hypothetical protein
MKNLLSKLVSCVQKRNHQGLSPIRRLTGQVCELRERREFAVDTEMQAYSKFLFPGTAASPYFLLIL